MSWVGNDGLSTKDTEKSLKIVGIQNDGEHKMTIGEYEKQSIKVYNANFEADPSPIIYLIKAKGGNGWARCNNFYDYQSVNELRGYSGDELKQESNKRKFNKLMDQISRELKSRDSTANIQEYKDELEYLKQMLNKGKKNSNKTLSFYKINEEIKRIQTENLKISDPQER